MCRVYQLRPSDVLRIADEEVALGFDISMATIHRIESSSKVNYAAEQSGLEASTLAALLELL